MEVEGVKATHKVSYDTKEKMRRHTLAPFLATFSSMKWKTRIENGGCVVIQNCNNTIINKPSREIHVKRKYEISREWTINLYWIGIQEGNCVVVAAVGQVEEK